MPLAPRRGAGQARAPEVGLPAEECEPRVAFEQEGDVIHVCSERPSLTEASGEGGFGGQEASWGALAVVQV